MKKFIYLFLQFSLFTKFYENFSSATDSHQSKNFYSFSFLPLEIMEQISEQLLVHYSGQKVENKRTVRKNLVNFALVNKNFYQSVLEVIFKNQKYWDYFQLTISHLSKHRNLSDVVLLCKKYLLEKNHIFSPLVMTLCLKDMNLGFQEVMELNTLASYFNCLKKISLTCIHIFKLTPFTSFQNALSNFNNLASLHFEGMSIFGFFQFFPETLFLTLKKSHFLHQNLQSLILDFNHNKKNEEYAQFDHQFYGRGNLFDFLIKFLNLKKIGLVNINLQEEDGLQLSKILSKCSKKIQFLDLSMNSKIHNSFVEVALQFHLHSLQTLNLSKTRVNQDCKIFFQLTHLKCLIMNQCNELNMSIFKKLSESENMIHSLEELDVSDNPNLSFKKKNDLEILLKFKSLQQINIRGCNLDLLFKIMINFYIGKNLTHLRILF